MAEYEMTLVDRQVIARDTMAFWFDTNGTTYEFRAGQHADFVFIPPFLGDENDNSRTFSLASTPHDKDRVMVAMRMRATGFKNALKAARLGTKFRVSRPRGSFTLHKDVSKSAVLLAGGIGITPMRSILQSTTQQGLQHKLYLFYSNRNTQDAAFLEELEDLAVQNPLFTLVPTITRLKGPMGAYHNGYIDRALLARYLRDLNEPVYYVAGPSGMVASMTALLRDSGISDDDVRTEEFGDYKLCQSPMQ
jgi:ferredoxin-NADP reductase